MENITINSTLLNFPQKCANCLSEANDKIMFQGKKKKQKIIINIPYCKICKNYFESNIKKYQGFKILSSILWIIGLATFLYIIYWIISTFFITSTSNLKIMFMIIFLLTIFSLTKYIIKTLARLFLKISISSKLKAQDQDIDLAPAVFVQPLKENDHYRIYFKNNVYCNEFKILNNI